MTTTCRGFQPFVAFEWIEGEIRHRRKLYKKLFFIDLLLATQATKVQVLFRYDDNSMTPLDHQDCFRLARPGHKVRLHVGTPTDPAEVQGKTFQVWQCTALPVIIQPYSDPQAFIADPPLMNKSRETIKQWDGQDKLKKEMNCKYWLNQKKCYRKDTCPFLHPTGDAFEQAKTAWIEERLEVRKIVTMDPNDPHQDKKPHALRALIFAQWVYTTIIPRLHPPSLTDDTSDGVAASPAYTTKPLVLDVAGGKGEVSMYLCHAFGIASIVVEPNVRKQPNYWFTRLRRLMAKYGNGNGSNKGDVNSNDSDNNDNDDDDKDSDDNSVKYIQPWPYPDIKPTYMSTLLNDAFIQRHQDLLLKVTLLIGIHADQATEPIVDTALQLGKPFAVVPCCVFGRENLHRQLKCGAPVATTKDLIQYLCEKDTGKYGGTIQTAYLDFEGKNEVVYWIPGHV